MPVPSKTVRIGGASGFWGDSRVGAPQLVASGAIDYLVFDYLAETTMAILAAARAKQPELGYATDFVELAMKPVLAEVARRGIKVISNAGGIHPQGCAEALQRVAAEQGIALRIAVVEGDDVRPQLPALRAAGVTEMVGGAPLPEKVLSANAYLGAWPIAQALAAGADVVITGRCVDSAVTLGALIHEFGWTADDHDRLAGGSLAGHIIECGCQATGGLYTDWREVPDWPDIGYPIAECRADGSFTITKPPGTGGLIARAAVAEQLLYEIGDPAAYVLPDVVCDFRDVRIEQLDADHVQVSGARGRPPTPSYKVSATQLDGFRCAGTLAIVGIDAAAKAVRTGEAILARTRAIFAAAGLPDYRATRIEAVGAETLYGPHARAGATREVTLRVVVDHPVKAALEFFAREIAPAGTSWSPGTTGASGRPGVSPLVKPFAFLIDKAAVPATLTIGHERIDVRQPATAIAAASPIVHAVPPEPAPTAGPMRAARLIELAWARSGDKGDTSNIGIIARRPDLLPWLWLRLTPEVVKAYFAHLVRGRVERYWLPGIDAINFMLHEALDGGGPASMRIDPLGKGMAQMLLDLELEVPAALLDR